METLIGPRVFRIALGYEYLIDRDELRHDPVMAVLGGQARATAQGVRAGGRQSTLSRLEHAPAQGEVLAPARYYKIGHDAAATEALFATLSLRRMPSLAEEATIDLDATDDPLYGRQKGGFFHCYSTATVMCRSTSLAAGTCWRPSCGAPTSTPRPGRSRRRRASPPSSARWPKVKIRLRRGLGSFGQREDCMSGTRH